MLILLLLQLLLVLAEALPSMRSRQVALPSTPIDLGVAVGEAILHGPPLLLLLIRQQGWLLEEVVPPDGSYINR